IVLLEKEWKQRALRWVRLWYRDAETGNQDQIWDHGIQVAKILKETLEDKGHLDRLARVAFHPSGNYLGTASFDNTWRLWDAETGEELLYQQGHSPSVYGLAFHPDGSLAASCGLDALARVWDLQSGRSFLALEGHLKIILVVGYWNLRKKICLYTIPTHCKSYFSSSDFYHKMKCSSKILRPSSLIFGINYINFIHFLIHYLYA
ncbi:U4/U6 small nuclear ribonucleoprotein PRP4-like protein, partial [Tanacetum coccineum]